MSNDKWPPEGYWNYFHSTGFANRLKAVVNRHAANPHGEDAVFDVVSRMWTTFLASGGFPAEFTSEDAFWSYIAVACRRRLLDILRREHYDRRVDLLDRVPAEPAKVNELDAVENILGDYLHLLGPLEYDILRDHLLGRPIAEIAKDRNVSRSAMYVKIDKILAKLRQFHTGESE